MQASELAEGVDYAYRPKLNDRDMDLGHIYLIGPVRSGKAKVRHAAGELAGLEEWVPTRTLLCRWSERRAFLRDEAREAAIRAATQRECDEVLDMAISTVFDATGEEDGFLRAWVTSRSKVDRLWARARMQGDPDDHPLAFTDRNGLLHLPYEVALEFAQSFAATEPETVALYIHDSERQLEAEGWVPGDRYAHEYLRRLRPAHALVRQWAGRGELDAVEREARRLRELVRRAIDDLRRAGAEDDARRIERGLIGQ